MRKLVISELKNDNTLSYSNINDVLNLSKGDSMDDEIIISGYDVLGHPEIPGILRSLNKMNVSSNVLIYFSDLESESNFYLLRKLSTSNLINRIYIIYENDCKSVCLSNLDLLLKYSKEVFLVINKCEIDGMSSVFRITSSEDLSDFKVMPMNVKKSYISNIYTDMSANELGSVSDSDIANRNIPSAKLFMGGKGKFCKVHSGINKSGIFLGAFEYLGDIYYKVITTSYGKPMSLYYPNHIEVKFVSDIRNKTLKSKLTKKYNKLLRL